MRADRDDAPHYLQHRKSNRWQLLTILGIGSAATWAAIAMFAKPITIDLTTLKNAIHTDNRNAPNVPMPSPAPTQEVTSTPHPQKQIHNQELHWETDVKELTWVTTPQPQQVTGRQTVFNDQNYKPRTDINTIAAVRTTQPSEDTEKPQRREKPQAIRRGPESWQWESYNGRQREYAHGGFYWLEINGKIDWSSVCLNEQAGSLRHRDCRLGAKVSFARMCGRYPPACQAENGYNPAM